MARFTHVLALLALLKVALSAAQSGEQRAKICSVIPNLNMAVAPTSTLSYTNTTSYLASTITSSPSLLTAFPSTNTGCSSCVVAADQLGLQQIFWFSQTWSITLDTKYVTVTSYNGSNATAITNTKTVLGDLQSVDTKNVPYIASLMMTLDNEVMYFNPNATLVRGTNGSVGTTSFPYGQAFAQITAINYRSILPNPECPVNMGAIAGESCVCVMNTWFPAFVPISSMTTTRYVLDRTYYTPLPSSVIDEANAHGADDIDELTPWDGEKFKAWLAEDEAFKAAFPNWADCAFWDAGKSPQRKTLSMIKLLIAGLNLSAAGPPAAKLPVDALTATVSTTTHVAGPIPSASPMPFLQPLPHIATPTTHAVSVPTGSPSPKPKSGPSSSDTGGGSSEPQSSGAASTGYESSGPPRSSDSSGNARNPAFQGSQGDSGSSGNSANTGSPDGKSGDTGSESHSSQGSSRPSGGQKGPSIKGGGTIGSFSSGSGFNGPDSSPSTAPFLITAGGHTISGQVQGSIAAVVAGTTIFAGSAPSSAGGALISVHPGASSIAVNGNSQPLPTPGPAPGVTATPAPIATIGSHTIMASPGASEVYYAGTTLSQNGPHATIDSTDLYVGSSGLVVGGSSTVAIPTYSTTAPSSEGNAGAVTFTAAGQTFTSFPSGLAVGGTTIQSGSAAVISGITISYGPAGLAIGTSTIPIPTSPPSSGAPGSGPTHVFTLGGQTFTANPTAIDIAGTTLTAGGPAAMISGTAVSIGSSGLVIASSTYAIPPGALPSSTLVVGSETFTILPTAIEVGGTTLSEGGSAITIQGTPISLGPSGLVVGSSTVPYRGGPLTAASQTSEGLGAIILAGFGPSSTAASASNGTSTSAITPGVEGFKGAAARLGGWEPMIVLALFLVGGWVVWH